MNTQDSWIKGKVGELKVPNVLSLIDKQNGYHASVEVINPTRNNLVHDYYDLQNEVGFIDLEAAIQSKIYRRYYYHSTGEKIAVREGICKRLELTQNEKIESIKDWFQPKDIVASSEMFRDLVHLGPTVLMIYANNISDKASFIGSELIEDDPIPYPLGYGCTRKGTLPSTPLPNFSQVNNFNLDMEAIITYPHHDPIKSTARVMKRGDVISYKIQENDGSVRFIELPPPLGRFQVDEHTGQCSHSTTDYPFDVTLVTRWPSDKNQVFNLFYYLLMKPPKDQALTFIGDIPLGPFRVEEYKATNFFRNGIAAIVDYYYAQNTSNSVPSKVIFTEDPSDYYSYETQVEVTIINYKEVYIDYEDRFDVSAIRQSTEEYLTSFIPVTRIGEIHAQQVDFNVYVTVKLYDRVNLIKGYLLHNTYKINNPAYIVKRFKVEDCEQLCSATEKCFDFSYCDDYDCSIYQSTRGSQYSTSFHYTEGCTSYSRSKYQFDLIPLVNKNYLSTISHVLQQIRNKVSSGKFRLLGLSAEDLFIVNGPEEIGDISQELHKRGSFKPLRGEDFPIIKTDRHFNEGQFKIEKSTLNECFMACLNDDDCNTLSYCVNQNKECILSGETSSSLNNTFEDKTSHADGCDIYQKSFINLFHEYPGKNLVLDAVSTIPDVPIGDCASTCAQSESFNCESFDYCENNNNRNQSICLLHVNHIVIDKTREINITNWKFAEAGCSHYSKKSELDYEHKVGLALKDDMKESIVGTFDHLSLEHCASKCNSDPNCFTLEFCETIDYNQISGRSASLSSCTLTNLKPSNIQHHLFEESKTKTKICSIYINHKKIIGKSEADPPIQTNTTESLTKTSTKSNDFSLAIGLGTIAFILAFAAGFTGFRFTPKEGFVKKAKLKMTVPMKPTRETK
ncbi:uncharacterized protein LOC112539883 [Tetranychus urticae]|uniref:uncharacterized protein LOC112539883 n=1 Tax=Tetranychus urticae TaxID=32264 RepID=UPI000D6529D0|nr:uncharacterized protein LOC112539883 [Tetranychus urticae]